MPIHVYRAITKKISESTCGKSKRIYSRGRVETIQKKLRVDAMFLKSKNSCVFQTKTHTCGRGLKPGISTSTSTNARHTHAPAEMVWFVDDSFCACVCLAFVLVLALISLV